MSTLKLPAASGGGSISIKGPASSGSDVDLLDTSGNLKLSDSDELRLGTGDDFKLYHNGSHSYITNATGKILIEAKAGETSIECEPDESVKLYYNNTKKWESINDGWKSGDDVKGIFGNDDDLKIYHSSGTSFIDNVTSELRIRSQYVALQPEGGGEQMLYATEGGSVDLYHDGNKKLETISAGVGVGTGSTTPNPGVALQTAGTIGIGNSSGVNSQSFIEFRRSATQIGSVTQNGTTGVNFNTSSDYRLKENQVAISDGITRLKTLKPYRFNFKAEPSITVDGFFAHEVTAVPEAIVGTIDAMAAETFYEEGDTLPSGKKVGDVKTYSSSEIEPQQIDQAKLVPLLTAALQEAITKIETLETKVAALEAG